VKEYKKVNHIPLGPFKYTAPCVDTDYFNPMNKTFNRRKEKTIKEVHCKLQFFLRDMPSILHEEYTFNSS
jgi:hypothetical protein